ncbi:sulfatase [Candidatus Hydrogenedentota bacterium]
MKPAVIIRVILISFLTIVAASCATMTRKPGTTPPNFVILFADDMGYGDLGCYGHPTIRTPRLDRMADEGIRLTQFYSAAPSCTPSRAALLTGRYQVRSGLVHVLFPRHDFGLPAGEITIAEALKTKGYATGAFGKWHLGHLEPFMPTQNGFDYFYGMPYSNDLNPQLLIRNNEVLERPAEQSTLTKRYTEEAIKFIERSGDKPFLVYLAYTMPHVPLHTSKDFAGKSSRGLYGDTVEEIDWSVGQILDYLKEQGLEENTLVFFTSDNGPWLDKKLAGGSAGLLRHGKATTWEGGIREPAIARWPGRIPAGQVSQEVGITMDLFKTCTELAGVEMPDGHIVDGKVLMPILTGQGKSPHDMLYFFQNRILAAARQGPWKIHYHVHDKGFKYLDKPSLYNVELDPSETIDMADDYPEIVKAMDEKVQAFKKNLKQGMPDKAPEGMNEEWKKNNPRTGPPRISKAEQARRKASGNAK